MSVPMGTVWNAEESHVVIALIAGMINEVASAVLLRQVRICNALSNKEPC